MNDGRIIEDKVIEKRELGKEAGGPVMGKISAKDKVRLGVRNTFNIIPKFLLLLVVFLFVTISVCAVYTSYKEAQTATDEFGYNVFFENYSEDRVIVKHKDSAAFTEDELEKIGKIKGVESVVKDDVLLDKMVSIESDYLSFYGNIFPLDSLGEGLDEGAYPEDASEAVIRTDPEMGSLMGEPEDIFGKRNDLYFDETGQTAGTVKVSGLIYSNTEDSEEGYENDRIYLTEEKMSELRAQAYMSASTVKITAGDREYTSGGDEYSYRLIPTSKVKKGRCIVPEEFDSNYTSGKATGKNVKIKSSNMYFSSSKTLKVSNVFTEKTYNNLVGLETYDEHMEDIFISNEDFTSLFDKGIYQISVYASNSHEIDSIGEELKGMDLQYLPLKDSLSNGFEEAGDILSIVQVPFLVLIVVVVFFIAYFVVRLILKSRDTYYATIRMLGMSKKDIKMIQDVEMLVVVTIAFLLFLVAVILIAHDIINFEYIKYMTEYMSVKGYALLYLVMLAMSYLISSRASRKLFAASAMQAYRGEV